MTEEQKKEFKQLSDQLIKWLCENYHPHHTVIITPTSAELLEGTLGHYNGEFLKD